MTERSGTSSRPAQPPPASVTIVLPAFNEAARIGGALDELFGYLERSGPARRSGRAASELGAWDVLVVDDGSDDETASLVESRPEARSSSTAGSPRLRVLRRPHAGKGGAVAAGILAATGDLVVFMDADMATPPDQIPLVTAALVDHDVALGSRVQPDGSDRRASQPLYRRLLGRVYRMLAGPWVTGNVPDTQCGFKGFRRDVGHDIFGRLRISGIAFDAEVIFLARKLGYRIAIVPIMWHDVHGSRMSVSLGLAWSVLWDLLRIPIIHRRIRARSAAASTTDPGKRSSTGGTGDGGSLRS